MWILQAVIEIRMLWHAAYTLKGLNKYKYIIQMCIDAAL